MNSSGTDRHQIPFIFLVPFLCIAFGLAWGILGLFIVFPEQMQKMCGPLTGQHPLFYLAVYAPAIAGVLIVIYHGRIRGLQRYLKRFLLFRCSTAWYAFLFLGIPLLFYVGSALKGELFKVSFPFPSFLSIMTAMMMMAIKGPVEEFGWRGLVLPVLQRRLAPLWAGLLLGLIWGFWHMPAFLLSGTPQSAWSFTPFFAGSVAVSVIVTALFNKSHGSILLPALFHFQLNNPLWPDAQPYDMYLFMAAAVVVVWLNRRTMFTRAGAVSEVMPSQVTVSA